MSDNPSQTLKNLEAAFAGESMAHIKYRYFADVCRKAGDEETAKLFESTAEEEVRHAIGHVSMLIPRESLTPERCLELAIEGETHEYTEMYPSFRTTALEEAERSVVEYFDEQIDESREHAERFKALLERAARRFQGLAKAEKLHAGRYEKALEARRAQA